MRRLLRKTLSTLLYPLAYRREKRARHSYIRILTYHRISYDLSDRLAVSPSAFLEQMQYIHDAGYRVVSMEDIYYHITNREHSLDKLVAITFDDGYLDNYTYAAPILRMFKYDATIFLATDSISDTGKRRRSRMASSNAPMLNWDEIREMNEQGITIGSHTHTHCDLTQISPKRVIEEIRKSKKIIEEKIKMPVHFFCYPRGKFNNKIKKMVKDAGYLGAYSVLPGPNSRRSDLYALKRTEVSGEDTLFDFKKKLSGAYDILHRHVQRSQRRREKRLQRKNPTKDYNKKIKVLHVIDSLVAEGAEQLLLDILCANDSKNLEYVVCCLASGGPLVEEIQDIGIPVCIIGRRHKADLRALWKLRGLIREFKPDIVHTHLFTSSFWGRIAAFLSRRKLVMTEHNTSDWKRWYHRLANKLLSLVTERFIAVSQTVKDSLVKSDRIAPEKVSVIRNGVSISRLVPHEERREARQKLNCEDDDILAVTIAALNEQKGHKYLIESAKEFVRKKPNVKIACVGDGPLRRELENHVSSESLSKNIIFTGSRRDIGDILNAADIFVMPSLYEGLSISLLEAAAMGKPIITTAVGASTEVFENRKTGLLVKTRDPHGIADAIGYCIDHKEEASEMGKRASKHVKSKFAISKTAKEYETVYREIVG